MDSDAFEGLETRISKVMKLVQQLKQENEGLRAELQLSRERIASKTAFIKNGSGSGIPCVAELIRSWPSSMK